MIEVAAEMAERDAFAIIGSGRDNDLCEVRWACYVALRDLGWTLKRIGKAFHRDHTTICHGLERAKDHHGRREEYFRALCAAVASATKEQTSA